MWEKDARGLQRKHLATTALQTDGWEEFLNFLGILTAGVTGKFSAAVLRYRQRQIKLEK